MIERVTVNNAVPFVKRKKLEIRSV